MSDPARRPVPLLLAALALGGLAGLAEAAVALARWGLEPVVQFLSADIVWMAPVADAGFLAVLGLALVGLHLLAPRLLNARAVLAVLVAGAVGLALLDFGGLHWAAGLVLGLGVGVQAARSGLLDRLAARPGRLLGGLALLTALLGLGVHGGRRIAEARLAGSLPAASPESPNIVLLVLDTVRSWNLSLYGYARPTTPRLEELAPRALVFDNALAVAPWTLPSHASMFTGRLPHELSTTWRRPLDRHDPTLAERLGAAGYATAGFVGNVNYVSRETGLARGFGSYVDYRVTPARVVFSSAFGRRLVPDEHDRWGYLKNTAGVLNGELFTWLDRRPVDRPFFAFLNYFDSHDPVEPPEGFAYTFGNTPDAPVLRARVLRLPYRAWKPEVRQAAIDAYDDALRYMDAQIGRVVDELDRRKLLDRTIIVVTADHGEQFGEHGLYLHGNSLYRPLLDVPLLILDPRRPAARVQGLVSLRDLGATLLELAGQPQGEFPGRSLTRWLAPGADGPRAERDTVYAELDFSPRFAKKPGPIAKGAMWSVFAGGRRLIREADGKELMFDIWADRPELRDLAADSAEAARLPGLRQLLDSARRTEGVRNRGFQPWRASDTD